MKKKILLVIDMQNDFVTGALANKEAETIIPAIKAKINEYKEGGFPVYFTRDTHNQEYMNTQEGQMLPVPHCVKGTDGWNLISELAPAAKEEDILDKPTFGAVNLPAWLEQKLGGAPEEIELCGVCTDICVISNAMILKGAFPETKVCVSGSHCAGVTIESHRNALEAMKACQVIVTE